MTPGGAGTDSRTPTSPKARGITKSNTMSNATGRGVASVASANNRRSAIDPQLKSSSTDKTNVMGVDSLNSSLTVSGGGAANNGTTESEPENGGGVVTPVLGPEATPRARVGHGHVKSASISAGSGNSQSSAINRETVASASAAERDSTRWWLVCVQCMRHYNVRTPCLIRFSFLFLFQFSWVFLIIFLFLCG